MNLGQLGQVHACCGAWPDHKSTCLEGVRYRDWRDTLRCMGDPGSGHCRGKTMTFCEATVRRLERGGGVGQWLLAVKDDHLRQFAPAHILGGVTLGQCVANALIQSGHDEQAAASALEGMRVFLRNRIAELRAEGRDQDVAWYFRLMGEVQ